MRTKDIHHLPDGGYSIRDYFHCFRDEFYMFRRNTRLVMGRTICIPARI